MVISVNCFNWMNLVHPHPDDEFIAVMLPQYV